MPCAAYNSGVWTNCIADTNTSAHMSHSTPVRPIHTNEIQQVIDYARESLGLTPYTWINFPVAQGTEITMAQFEELKDQIDDLYDYNGCSFYYSAFDSVDLVGHNAFDRSSYDTSVFGSNNRADDSNDNSSVDVSNNSGDDVSINLSYYSDYNTPHDASVDSSAYMNDLSSYDIYVNTSQLLANNFIAESAYNNPDTTSGYTTHDIAVDNFQYLSYESSYNMSVRTGDDGTVCPANYTSDNGTFYTAHLASANGADLGADVPCGGDLPCGGPG